MAAKRVQLTAPDVAQTTLRALTAGGFVWVLLRIVDDAPPAVTATVMTLPFVIGVGFAAMAAHQSDAYVVSAAGHGLAAMPAFVFYVALTARFFTRLSLPRLMVMSLVAWATLAWVLTGIPDIGPGLAVLLTGAALVVSVAVFPFDAALVLGHRTASHAGRRAWPVAIQAGVVVVVLSLFAGALGPRLSALLAALPLATIFVIAGLKLSDSGNWPATLQSARLATLSLTAYLLATIWLVRTWGALAGTLAAFVPSIAVAAATVAIRRRLSQRSLS
ncbi:hypothetical protein LX81_04154 [Palleronia aestuarii]|uniref:Uncharacterized protein n=1 Tax=Palleronia aestuarii TaxID=568105 RepID=A0A2W7MRZ8_9RHOB|nr:hypothetical protein [Palleronia aestuarii]PZX10660.1 hypothetical protein LX81_04154 [Palleronia aestuarii]